jgi:hypothetical protein
MISTILSTRASLSRFVAVAALGLAAGVGAVGCGSTVDPSESAVSPDKAAQADNVGGHVAGPGAFFLNHVDSLDLRADQKQTVAALRASLHEQAAPVRAARAAMGAEVARQVRAGALDEARLQPLHDQITAAVAATKPGLQAAVQQIHDTLDAGQRSALVASMRAKGEHFKGHHAMKEHMQRIAAELGLSDDQVATIRASVKASFAERGEAMHADHAQMKAHMETLATAFQSDTFDAKALGVGDHLGGAMGRFAGMRKAFLQAAVPVLSPAQREKLAAKIEARTALAEDEE